MRRAKRRRRPSRRVLTRRGAWPDHVDGRLRLPAPPRAAEDGDGRGRRDGVRIPRSTNHHGPRRGRDRSEARDDARADRDESVHARSGSGSKKATRARSGRCPAACSSRSARDEPRLRLATQIKALTHSILCAPRERRGRRRRDVTREGSARPTRLQAADRPIVARVRKPCAGTTTPSSTSSNARRGDGSTSPRSRRAKTRFERARRA